jgi:outer membrane protein OmpA-like peptidoglycan-associated protein
MSAKFWVLAALLMSAVPAAAQTQSPPTTDQPRAGETQRVDGRALVGTSAVGDIGLFFVPTADTNGRGRGRGSVARTSRNAVQGQLNVADFTASVSYGLWDRVDVFLSWDAVARVDRDLNPLFIPTDSQTGGVDPAAPYARDTWSGNRRADLRVGGKVKVIDELGGAPVSFAIRGSGRLPTGDAEDGGGVGAPAFDADAIVSRWVSRRLVLTGSVGASQRNNPTDPVVARIPPSLNWGAGVGFLPAETVLLHAEFIGDRPLKRDTTNLDQRLVAVDGSLSPIQSIVDNHRAVATGITWMARSGFFLGAAARFDFPMIEEQGRSRLRDYTDLQVRLGWRPGPRPVTAIAAAEPPPPAVAAPETPPPAPAPPAAEAAAPAPAPARREFVFEDVYFDFDRYSLRPEALRILDEAVRSMNETKTIRMVIEGHTCNIGTTEYNLALGERRAHAVYEYLTGHGISASRLSAVTFGEERPKYDNSREETRRMNRRAAMVVRLETTDQR